MGADVPGEPLRPEARTLEHLLRQDGVVRIRQGRGGSRWRPRDATRTGQRNTQKNRSAPGNFLPAY